MKRDWDLIRKQLTDIEDENDVLADIPQSPKWTTQSEEQFRAEYAEYVSKVKLIGGHLELLSDNGYIEGVQVLRGADGHISFGTHSPRLTMAGHDLLDTMRSKTIWNSVKETAKKKGVELTFDVIKTLASLAVKQVFSS